LKSDPYGRERSLAVTIAVLAGVLAIATEGYFSRANLTDLFLANLPVLIVALGATMVIVSGEIDISVGSVFAICSVVAGVAAKTGLPMPLVAFVIALVGGVLGAINGSLVAYLRIPSIVVTLATMIGLRDALRWATQGAWVQDLPANFQWLGLSQSAYPIVMGVTVVLIVCAIAWGGGHLAAGRAIYATGSNAVAARLAGLDTALVKWSVFTLAGALTGLSAVLNAARFNQIPSNAGIGLEMKVIASVVVGGASVAGGTGSVLGTLLGVVLLAAIGPALTYLGVSAYWERAVQGAIILAAVAADGLRHPLYRRVAARLTPSGSGARRRARGAA
jgi:ribose/xylose/arabinose/galactoside ABC-type transport system permease subunit